jgi:hypothetical protein
MTGMDVLGKRPSTKEGEHFRANVWHWRPIAIYCERLAPTFTDWKTWHYNDGVGLSEKRANELADILQAEMDSGRTAEYQKDWVNEQMALPDETCWLCNGTGRLRRDDRITLCNACSGKGKRRPHETYYPFDIAAVAEFIQFLRGCGGFEIW